MNDAMQKAITDTERKESSLARKCVAAVEETSGKNRPDSQLSSSSARAVPFSDPAYSNAGWILHGLY